MFRNLLVTTILLFLSLKVSALETWQEKIIQDAEDIYTPLSLSLFHKPIYFSVVENGSVAASANHNYDNLTVDIYSGLLKSTRLTPDSLRMIICHELGHLFGGAPRKAIPMEWEGPVGTDGKSLMSAEGQADYYAGTVCFKKMLELEEKVFPYHFDPSRAGPVLRNKCAHIAGFEGVLLENCLRGALAGLDFLNLVIDFPISCEKSDSEVADITISDSYPGRQCRLDTIINATLCKSPLNLSMDMYDDLKNTCEMSYAIRPLCWYR